jgi:hypothetical protein
VKKENPEVVVKRRGEGGEREKEDRLFQNNSGRDELSWVSD